MNKLITIICILIILSGCSLLDNYSWIGIEEIETIEDAVLFVKSEITYKADNTDFWQYPDETYYLKTGDCEDMAALLAYIMTYNLQLEGVKIVMGVRQGGNVHACVKYDGVTYDATDAISGYTYYTLTVWSLENYLLIAKAHHI